MTVYLTNTTKKHNSTAIPANGTAVSCVLKEGCSVINPVLIFERANVGHSYNYVYIPDFGRRYFVNDIIYQNAQVIYSCSVDVLATYKDTIGSSSQYVLRSAYEADETIIDTYYPVTTDIVQRVRHLSSPWERYLASGGMFVVGIVNNTGVNYYGMDFQNYRNLLGYLMSDEFVTDDTAFTQIDLTINKQLKLMVNPLQYITSVIWFPINLVTVIGTSTVKIGHVTNITYSAPPQGALLTGYVHEPADVQLVPISHPQESARGSYLNSPGFTQCRLTFPPFGSFELDPLIMSESESVYYSISADPCTGIARLRIFSKDANGVFNTLVTSVSQIGVSIPVTQIITPGVSPVDIGVKLMTSMASIAMGNTAGAIAGGLSAIDSYYQGNVPKVSVIGSRGSTAELYGGINLEYTFKLVADDDTEDHGKPLCKKRVLNTLPGYQMILNPHIHTTGTGEEDDMINSYLTSGYFYE